MGTFVGITAVSHSAQVRVPAVGDILDPTGLASTVNPDDGGTFDDDTYYWVVTALGDGGETPVSAEVSETVTQGTNEQQTITVDATAGQFKLTYDSQQTANLAFDISTGNLVTALNNLNNIAPGDVTVTGGPGDSGGTTPYVVTFQGTLANTDVSEMTAVNGTTPLSGGGASVSVSTTTPGVSGDTVTLDWDEDSGAESYRVYRGTTTALEDHYFEVTENTFTDTGATGTAGTPPVTDTAASELGQVHLVPGVTTVVDVDHVATRRALSNHSTIGQWIVTAVNASTATAGTLPANS